MLMMKLKLCLDHWKGLTDKEKKTSAAKHLRAASDAGIKLAKLYDHERGEAVRLRLKHESRGG